MPSAELCFLDHTGFPRKRHKGCSHIHRARTSQDGHCLRRGLCFEETGAYLVRFRRLSTLPAFLFPKWCHFNTTVSGALIWLCKILYLEQHSGAQEQQYPRTMSVTTEIPCSEPWQLFCWQQTLAHCPWGCNSCNSNVIKTLQGYIQTCWMYIQPKILF